jgi:hypothetical protein
MIGPETVARILEWGDPVQDPGPGEQGPRRDATRR